MLESEVIRSEAIVDWSSALEVGLMFFWSAEKLNHAAVKLIPNTSPSKDTSRRTESGPPCARAGC